MAQQGKPRENALADYIPVSERVEKFWDKFPDGRIVTAMLENDTERGFVLFRAEVYRSTDEQFPAATGHASELKSEGYVQRTSHVEVCETSAVGRALAMLGFEVKKGIASREEVESARNRPQPIPLRSPASRDEQCEQVARDVKPAPLASSAPVGMITDGQKKALDTIGGKTGKNPQQVAHERYGVAVESLTTVQAATMIQEMQKG